jgi:hypothetical protein
MHEVTHILEVQQQPELEARPRRDGDEGDGSFEVVAQPAVEGAGAREGLVEGRMLVAVEDGIHTVVDFWCQTTMRVAVNEQLLCVVDDLQRLGPQEARSDDHMR